MPEIKTLYQDTFARSFFELLEMHKGYKSNILDRQLRLEEHERELEGIRESLNLSGLPNTIRYQTLETGIEKLNIQRSALKCDREKILSEIGQLAEKMISFWKDILNDYEWGHISRGQFVYFLSRYKILLHTGNSQGLVCYSGPDVNKINDFIESFNIY
jgi:hypothetical protein